MESAYCSNPSKLLQEVSCVLHTLLSGFTRVFDIDKALLAGDFRALMEITNKVTFESVLNSDIQSSYELCTALVSADSVLRRPHLESRLLIAHAQLISQLEKIDNFPDHACCSCERRHQRKSVTRVKLSDDLGSEVWPRLKSFILERSPNAAEHVLYMCNYCKPIINLPPPCVLNGLEMVPTPVELAELDPLSRQLVQHAKCYQTVVRLGTYTGKVPIYISLKACEGTMFFPLNKTLETLDQIKEPALPDPELYIMLSGRPTKTKVVWRSLVDVNHVKAAVRKLKERNLLYRYVSDDC